MENQNTNTNTELTNKETSNTNEGSNNSTPKTYTQEEVDKLLQSEADKRVTEALKKAEKKNEEKLKEAQKLAAMNEQEKFQYELEQREKAIIEKEKALALSENKNEASRILAEKGLSLELVDFVVAEEAETMNKNINKLDKAFKASVRAEVEKRLGNKAPAKTNTDPAALTKKDFAKMTLAEQAKLYQESPEIYNSLV